MGDGSENNHSFNQNMLLTLGNSYPSKLIQHTVDSVSSLAVIMPRGKTVELVWS